MTKLRWAVLFAAVLALLSGAASAAPPSGQGRSVTSPAVSVPSGITITGVDLHDGIIQKFGSTYYMYGTEYGCGFQWGVATTDFCGFGVVSAPSLSGPWSSITQLVTPTMTDPWSGRTWDAQCMRNNGAGCFNPRMVQRPDGQYILWFNAPDDYNIDHANSYNNYLCSGPTGPCTTFHKPSAYTCATSNGDLSVFVDGATAYLVCTGSNVNNYAEFVEQLDSTWTTGTGNIAGHGSGALFSAVEGAGIYKDSGSGLYVMTLANPECGYCDGEPTIFGTAPNPIGPWSSPVGHAAAFGSGAQAMSARYRAMLSGNTCGGQPRTVMMLDGQAYQGIDLWDAGKLNQTAATYMIQPLNFHNAPNNATIGWQPFDPWSC